jgi:hypothetical protein
VKFLHVGKAPHAPDNDEDSEVEFLRVGKAPRALDNDEDSEQAWTDGAVPGPGDARTGSAEDLAGSAVDVIPPHVPDDAIDQLTADLAAFCFDRLERSANEAHNLVSTNNLEDELQVRFELKRVDYRILMLSLFR